MHRSTTGRHARTRPCLGWTLATGNGVRVGPRGRLGCIERGVGLSGGHQLVVLCIATCLPIWCQLLLYPPHPNTTTPLRMGARAGAPPIPPGPRCRAGMMPSCGPPQQPSSRCLPLSNPQHPACRQHTASLAAAKALCARLLQPDAAAHVPTCFWVDQVGIGVDKHESLLSHEGMSNDPRGGAGWGRTGRSGTGRDGHQKASGRGAREVGRGRECGRAARRGARRGEGACGLKAPLSAPEV